LFAAGLSVALVEQFDFSSGTSSRSTKLIHGGVRYLQQAVLALDAGQYRMVKEALAERANLVDIAPHLASPLPIMLPVYKCDVSALAFSRFIHAIHPGSYLKSPKSSPVRPRYIKLTRFSF